MENEKIIRSIIEKCDIFYDDSLLSEESIIEKYLTFFAKQLTPDNRTVNFAFHTGSLCFDVVSIVALTIGCLAYDVSSNDNILKALEIDDMVLFRGERYRWGGIQKMVWHTGELPVDYMVLKQDAKGKNGASTTSIPYERNKHLVKPYFGTASATDGRGIGKNKTNRNDFISHVLEIPENEVPTTLGVSVVVVADKNEFIEICHHLRIRYSGDKYVELADIVPVSYYTSSGNQFQIGKNASKAQAVIKVTSKMSVARDLVLKKHENKVIGLLVTNVESLTINAGELKDLLRRKSLKFVYVIAPFNAESCDLVMEQYETANLFACTRNLLSSSQHTLCSDNKLTRELNRQISKIIYREIYPISVKGCWDWEKYKDLKEKLYAIKHSNWSGEDRDNFILSTIALMNLFTTSFFCLKKLEDAISAGKINVAVVSPESRMSELQNIAIRSLPMKEKCMEIVSMLLDAYSELYETVPKERELLQFLDNHCNEKTIIVVPKAYYAELFSIYYQPLYPNVACVTANRFDKSAEYDNVLAVGDITGKRFDSIQCYSSLNVYLLLYLYETKLFKHRSWKYAKSERKLNARIKGLKGDDYKKAIETDDKTDSIQDRTMQEFSDLDEFVDSMSMFDIRRLASSGTATGSYIATSEVKFVGIFTTGEQILFSKYYAAVVFDQNEGKVVETAPEKLLPGDILVFTKRNNYTSNIVDQIFDQLVSSKKLNKDLQDAAEKAFYWKKSLRKYKENNNLSYCAVAKELKKLGSFLQEVTIRQWLMEESHIVGPRYVKTMRIIAELTKDPYILENPEAYFEACRTVRHYRREILTLIAQAINDKLSNKEPVPGSAFEVVYENVEKLSETLELENVFELDEIANINNNMVNIPITETEVLM